MGIFATLARSSAPRTSGAASDKVLADSLRGAVPARFEAVGEALAVGDPADSACAVVGRELARDGVDLGEALNSLRSTYALVVGREPDFDSIRTLGVAWSDETLGYLHQVSCENPLTGLASLAHLRARLAEVQRGAENTGHDAGTTHSLVVLDLGPAVAAGAGSDLDRALVLARLADQVRLVFSGDETIAQAASWRLLVLAHRDGDLGWRVAALRELVAADLAVPVRVWIEGLPGSQAGLAAVLDELART